MEYFEKYTSNTYAGSGNQSYFNSDNTIQKGRIFYKISVGGKYNYSFLFSNIIDCTYFDGTKSHNNLICDSWQIITARVGCCAYINDDMWEDAEKGEKPVVNFVDDEGCINICSEHTIEISKFKNLTFDGSMSKNVAPGEFFTTDPVFIDAKAGEYLCLEITFKGKMIPYHEESIIPTFLKRDGHWVYSKYMPCACMVGCDREINLKIAYLGDSITQGIGTKINSYAHWNAVVSEKLDKSFSFWNLGLGFGRASDAASDGAWLFKAKQNDIIVVCYGVNDILQGRSAKEIKADLDVIADKLLCQGKKVILQTIPPFDYTGDDIEKWLDVNQYIKTVLSKKDCLWVFDNVPILQADIEHPYQSKYGGHPNETGCLYWAQNIYSLIKDVTETYQTSI